MHPDNYNFDKIIAIWDGQSMTGLNIIANNTLYKSPAQNGFYIFDAYHKLFHIVNNIINGGFAPGATRRNNLYTDVSWDQNPSKGWNPSSGELVTPVYVKGKLEDYEGIDPATVFFSHIGTLFGLADDDWGNDDLRLKAGSPAIGAGINFFTYILALADSPDTATALGARKILDTFPCFDWTKDASGADRGDGAAWDIGAYTYDYGRL